MPVPFLPPMALSLEGKSVQAPDFELLNPQNNDQILNRRIPVHLHHSPTKEPTIASIFRVNNPLANDSTKPALAKNRQSPMQSLAVGDKSRNPRREGEFFSSNIAYQFCNW